MKLHYTKAMENKLLNLIFFVAAMWSFQACTGTYAVGPPPPYPYQPVVVAPGPNYVWVPGRYIYRHHRYVWSPGYHQIPPRGRSQYVEGHWNQTPKGNYQYQRGHWR